MKLLNGFSLASAALGALSLSFGLSLVACGSDSSSSNDDNKGSNGIAEYETLDEMVHCTKSHYGEVAHVAETDSIYECTSEGWVVADSAKVEEILSSSDSKSDNDDGKSSGSKDDSGDSDEKSSSSITASAEDTAKVETVKVDSVTVLGLAEKGPFTKGTVVNVYGLDSALNKSKTSFKGAVNDDKGNYSVSKIKLSSQYAMVEVNGFFNNEVTGKVTSGTKTKLRALVDLSEGDTVKANVNILTDLEYERAIALVKNDKYNVPAAKARATKEILAAFGVNVDSVTATKISLSGENAATNGLLAASVAVIGNLSLSKFQARLGDVAESLAATGSIGDTLRAEIADDLSLLDSNGAMVDIMKNIKTLNAKATGVDDLLYAFWSDNYKLPACDAKAEETIAKNGNKLSSNYGAGYACTSNRWHKSTALDTELGLCVAKNEGKYETTKGGKYYTCKAGQWREITKEQYTLGACTEEIAKDASKKYKSVDNKKYFVCKDLQWEEITADEYELKDCGTDKNETVVAAKTSKVSYVCLDGAWRKATAQEEAFGYCSKVDSTKFETLEKVSYACLEEGWTKVDDLTAELGFCTGKIPESKMFETKSGEYYRCVENVWISVDKVTAAIGKYCESENDGYVDKVSDGDLAGSYLCIADRDWTLCGEDNDNEYKVDYDKVCQDMVWREAKPGEKAAGAVCDETKNEKVVKGVDSYFTCLDGEWVSATERDFEVGKPCIKSNKDDIVLDGKYMCRDDNETPEWTACEGDNDGLVKGDFACAKGTWRPATETEIATMFVCPSASVKIGDEKLVSGSSDGYNDTMYDCSGDGWKVRYKTGSMVDPRTPTKTYRTVTIGTQTWMAENLNYDPGDVTTLGEYAKTLCYEDNAAYCLKYGRLYTYEVAVNNAECAYKKECYYRNKSNVQGICPSGWHLPSLYGDIRLLLTYVDPDYSISSGIAPIAGKLLKSKSGWKTQDDGTSGNGTDFYGFSVLPAGLWYRYVGSFGLGEEAGFWTSSEQYTNDDYFKGRDAYRIALSYENEKATDNGASDKDDARSVRCVKD